jgi:predicted transglutaminase-like cysteine proteinase
MGQAIITGGGPTGLYDVTIKKHAGKSVARLAAIAARLVILGGGGSPVLPGLIPTAQAAVTTASGAITTAQIALDAVVFRFTIGTATRKEVTAATTTVLEKQAIFTQKQRDLSLLKIERGALTKEQVRINTAMATEARTGVWCTDLTEDLAVGATVGTMEMNSADDQIILAPGGLVSKSIGLLQHAGVSTGAAVFMNKARLPAAQKWKPTYRVGTITAIDYDTDKCDVGIEEQYSEEQGLPINQTGTAYTATKAAVQGWSDFAALNPTFALVTEIGDTKLSNTGQLQADMARINSEVNDKNKYKTDTEQYGKLEKWTIMQEGGSGDCEDFALTKAKKLLDLGYAASAIKIEVGTAPNGQGHAWLVVQTVNGDYALDNNYKNVMVNGATPYAARRRQTGMTWTATGVKLSSVPIEYMDGLNSTPFVLNDKVVVQFTGQVWTAPKVVGYETNPQAITEYVVCLRLASYVPPYVTYRLELIMVGRTGATVEESVDFITDWNDTAGLPTRWAGWDNVTNKFAIGRHRVWRTGDGYPYYWHSEVNRTLVGLDGNMTTDAVAADWYMGWGYGYIAPLALYVEYADSGSQRWHFWEEFTHNPNEDWIVPSGPPITLGDNRELMTDFNQLPDWKCEANSTDGIRISNVGWYDDPQVVGGSGDRISIAAWGSSHFGARSDYLLGHPCFIIHTDYEAGGDLRERVNIPYITDRSAQSETTPGNYITCWPVLHVHIHGVKDGVIYYAVVERSDTWSSFFPDVYFEYRKAHIDDLASHDVLATAYEPLDYFSPYMNQWTIPFWKYLYGVVLEGRNAILYYYCGEVRDLDTWALLHTISNMSNQSGIAVQTATRVIVK